MNKRKGLWIKLLLVSIVIFTGLSFFIKRNFFLIKEFPHLPKNEEIDLCEVIGVYDGDTIKVRFSNGGTSKIRLIGIDCPELNEEREEIRFLAQIAKRFTFINLFKKKVALSYDWEFRDKYGRILAYVWLNDVLFNEWIVKQGFAFSFLKFPFRKDFQQRFKEAEKWARLHKKGLWSIGKERIITSQDSFLHIGEYLGVKFKCLKIHYGKKYIFLDSSLNYKHSFSALIPLSERRRFKNIGKMENRVLIVKGLIEKYKNKTQIMVFSPLQIEILF